MLIGATAGAVLGLVIGMYVLLFKYVSPSDQAPFSVGEVVYDDDGNPRRVGQYVKWGEVFSTILFFTVPAAVGGVLIGGLISLLTS